jgi:hypothetical protein
MMSSSLPIVIGSFVGLMRCFVWYFASFVIFSSLRMKTATTSSGESNILSQQLQEVTLAR